MKRETSDDKLFNVIWKAQNATIYNLSTFTCKTARDLNGSTQQPTKAIYRLIRKGMIKEIKLYPNFRQFKWNTFYTPTGLKTKELAFRECEHNSGIRDIVLGFVYLYPDYSVNVIYEPQFRLTSGIIYKPDAHIRLFGINGDIKDYLIEFERTRSPEAILKEKILAKCEKLDLKSTKLSPHAKILFVYTHERFNVYTRPIEYQDHKEILMKIEEQTKTLARLVKANTYKYLFMPFHDFYRLNESVWITPEGIKAKLMNK